MRIAVCLKQVPNTEARLRVGRDGKWIDEEGLSFVLNESDEYALEEAQRLTEAAGGGEVVVFSLGPDRAQEALRKALAKGADRAVLLSDPVFAGGDATASGRALAAAIRNEGDFDLVLTGSQSDDVGYGGTGSVIAGELGWPHVWLVMGVELESSSAKVTREMESGMNEIVRVALPAVLEVQAGINHPRYAPLKGIMAAKRKPLDRKTPADLGLDEGSIGAAGSRLEILSIGFPDSGEGAQMLEGTPEDVARQLVEKLQREARVL